MFFKGVHCHHQSDDAHSDKIRIRVKRGGEPMNEARD